MECLLWRAHVWAVEEGEAVEEETPAANASADEKVRQQNQKRRRQHVNQRVRDSSRASCLTHATVCPCGSL